MTDSSSTGWASIAFTHYVMNKTIGYGVPVVVDGVFKGFDRNANPNVFSLDVWLELVPEVFRDVVNEGLGQVAHSLLYMRAVEETRILFIKRMQEYLLLRSRVDRPDLLGQCK